MKRLGYLLFALVIFCPKTWAKPLVVISYFDAFGGAPLNVSQVVADKFFNSTLSNTEYEIKLCALETVFDKSFYQLEECLKNLPQKPRLILSLGESKCQMRLEMMAHNLDHTYGADNEGNERYNSLIIPNAPKSLHLSYPLHQMYCALSPKERKKVTPSKFAGSFVCNNLAFQFSWANPDLSFGFIHVPAHNCSNLKRKIKESVSYLSKMIPAAMQATMNPHSYGEENNGQQLPACRPDTPKESTDGLL